MSKYFNSWLGNIGTEYAHTRHNIGFDVAQHFVLKHGGLIFNTTFSRGCRSKMEGQIFICIKPTTYMNLSGKSF
jgi:PTH1 family peptidyl-tRNA hydrolase